MCWARLPGPGRLTAGPASADIDAASARRPGAIWLRGLNSDTTYQLRWAGETSGARLGHFHTVAPPPGDELFRFATVNDIHIGEQAFGFRHTMADPSGHPVPYPLRCLRAAIAEAREWGAQMLVVKGDLTQSGQPDEFATVATELAHAGVPAHVVLGNHDVTRRSADGRAILQASGVDAPGDPVAIDVPGLRIVLAHSAVWARGPGAIDEQQRETLASLVGAASTPCLVAMHHYPQRWRLPNLWPPGIPGPQARALLSALAKANPATMVASGHSHRHRRHLHQQVLTHAEIGSTKDYPGAWAGYVVHEGGIRQVVPRVADPDCIAWTEHSRRAVLGLWGMWSPGLRTHRCFSLTWPDQPSG